MSKLRKLVVQFLKLPPEVRFEDVRYLLEAFGYEENALHSFRDSQARKVTVPKREDRKLKESMFSK